MDQKVCLVGLLFAVACSGSTQVARTAHGPGVSVRARAPVSNVPAERVAGEGSQGRTPPPARVPLEFNHDADSDQVFVDNALRAIAQYREFLERAGDDPQYQPAVKRSREQIEDLEAAVEWVRSGMRARARN